MTNTTARTPGPWRLDPKRSLRVVAGDDHTVCATGNSDHLRDQWEANAAFIVRAANSHDELVAALADAQKRLRGAGMLGGDDDPVCAALAKARQP